MVSPESGEFGWGRSSLRSENIVDNETLCGSSAELQLLLKIHTIDVEIQ